MYHHAIRSYDADDANLSFVLISVLFVAFRYVWSLQSHPSVLFMVYLLHFSISRLSNMCLDICLVSDFLYYPLPYLFCTTTIPSHALLHVLNHDTPSSTHTFPLDYSYSLVQFMTYWNSIVLLSNNTTQMFNATIYLVDVCNIPVL